MKPSMMLAAIIGWPITGVLLVALICIGLIRVVTSDIENKKGSVKLTEPKTSLSFFR